MENKLLIDVLEKLSKLNPSIRKNGYHLDIYYDGFEITISSNGDCWINNVGQKGFIPDYLYKKYEQIEIEYRMSDDNLLTKILHKKINKDLREGKLNQILNG